MKCKVCKKRFTPKKEAVYQVCAPNKLLTALTGNENHHDAIDCPRCGCQNILAERLPAVK